jgi:hypothetical protein
MNKKYIPCEVCKCGECQVGKYRSGSWYCPLLKRQICEVCCYYDTQSEMAGVVCENLHCQHFKDL